ncbi:MAG: hypothetical protein PHX14_01630, partial [Syntrophomonadaceae bacterium]|nr:hypothetical protein [Syntrophomonadaceae bacterium]
MREYIIYVILVFLPIGAIMAYLLQKEGVPRKNAAMVVGISWLIIVTFPLSIAKMGTFIALMTYIVAILVMTRFLLGSKKEYAIESKGILVTGPELEQLLVNMERQGYEILTGQDSDYVSLVGEPVLSNLPGSQINELGVAEIAALADGDNNEPSLEDIKKTKEKDLAKPDMLNDSPADAMISVSIVDKEQEELHDQTAEEFPAEDVKDIPHAGNEFSMEESLAELESSSMVDVEMEAPDEDILAKSAVEEAVILEDMIADERAASELERLEEPEIGWPSLGEEPSEEIVEAFSKEIEVEPDEELENEAGETAEITLEAISEAIVPEVPEAEHTAEA